MEKLLVVLLFIGMVVAVFWFWLWSLIHCVQGEHPGHNDKLVWVLIIVFLGWLGSILYYFVQAPQVRRRSLMGARSVTARYRTNTPRRYGREREQKTPKAFERFRQQQARRLPSPKDDA